MDRRASSAVRCGTRPRMDAGQNFHITAGRRATKGIVQGRSPRVRACRCCVRPLLPGRVPAKAPAGEADL